ncbi:hypothetical protein LOTGIDRAFT_231562 [Lottia gigantea]|uniref:Uncharacterized protein n=1 Tax=Lottia gigantea TaxID=225164 RepID=V4AUE0_LOTGI|nr:hypothetical protein LOTGIDRAFT_231562 [Lottia gigantea]ESO97371.1 hypothetical protein LOTGIDRAFT_231562 [Lottia gigantea]
MTSLTCLLCNGAPTEDSLSRVRRGGWSMLRLGRGLQMLRLGKRTHPSGLDIYLDRDLHERQVPLPRYGKDLDWQNFLERHMLGNTEMDEEKRESMLPLTDPFLSEAIDGYPHMRPAPRGGRFKRSAGRFRYYPEVRSEERAVALPRFGRLIEKELKHKDGNDESKERAVPAPRFGRNPH